MIEVFYVDAFAERLFSGNPAAICPLQSQLDEDIMQNIAKEHNLSETAFLMMNERPMILRWFSPIMEVEFCGHATLAAGHVFLTHYALHDKKVEFQTKKGLLSVERCQGKGFYEMDFPKEDCAPCAINEDLVEAMGAAPKAVYRGANLMMVYHEESEVQNLTPNMTRLKTICARHNVGIIATAPASPQRQAHHQIDFISRFFAPAHGIDEDPVTGSAHCQLMPFWARQLGKNQLTAFQISQRGGTIKAIIGENNIRLQGQCIDYMHGQIDLGLGDLSPRNLSMGAQS